MAYFESTKITNIAGNVINPAEQQELYTAGPAYAVPAPAVRTATGSVDGQITLLRRIAKLMETQAATDPQQRQRITLDAVTANLTLGNVTIAAGTASIGNVNTVTTVTNLAGQFGWNQQILSDPARVAYNTGIRAQLTFS